MPDTAAVDPNVLGVLKQPFAEQVAFFRGKLGNLIPTATWKDVRQSGHDCGFMVAGAAKADLLADLAASVDRVIGEGKSIDAFRKDFNAIVDRHGWSYTGERMWRTRVIHTTNMSASYAAGRLAQLRAGRFKYWMYKHSDSVRYPRPLHVSWDGLTLPADHPWFRTHFPPNGWGCRCRVIGISSAAAARRQGGRMAVDAPDDGTDPATGTPAGIDPGWDYMPGDTVADTVAAMAKKTVQWEYTLAKAFMRGVPERVRDRLALAYRALPAVADDARRYAQRILDGRAGLEIPPYRTLGLLTADDARRVRKATGIDARLYDYAVDPSAVLHVRRIHGSDAAEAERGQRAVTADDYAVLPELLNAPDAVKESDGLLIYVKTIDGEKYQAVFEVRPKRRMLALKSMWVGSKAAPR